MLKHTEDVHKKQGIREGVELLFVWIVEMLGRPRPLAAVMAILEFTNIHLVLKIPNNLFLVPYLIL